MARPDDRGSGNISNGLEERDDKIVFPLFNGSKEQSTGVTAIQVSRNDLDGRSESYPTTHWLVMSLISASFGKNCDSFKQRRIT